MENFCSFYLLQVNTWCMTDNGEFTVCYNIDGMTEQA